MRVLDQALVKQKHPFLTGDKYSLADIIIYNELSMFMKLRNFTWEGREMLEFPNLAKWASKVKGSCSSVATLED